MFNKRQKESRKQFVTASFTILDVCVAGFCLRPHEDQLSRQEVETVKKRVMEDPCSTGKLCQIHHRPVLTRLSLAHYNL